jgi:hypothetical protein
LSALERRYCPGSVGQSFEVALSLFSPKPVVGSRMIVGVPGAVAREPTVVSGGQSRGSGASTRVPGCGLPLLDGVAAPACGLEGCCAVCPGVGAGVGLVPLGTRDSLEPVPGVPALDGKVKDCPGVGAGVGPVPLGTELPGGAAVPGDEPVPGDAPPGEEPVPPVWAQARLVARHVATTAIVPVSLRCIARLPCRE